MQCTEFREHHCAFVDDTLAGVELVRMQRHVAECAKCAEQDARVRRSLMWARSIRNIEPSADFAQRLEAKLQACRAQGMEAERRGNFRAVAAIGAVASLLMMAYVAESLHTGHAGTLTPPVARDVVLHPVVAMAPPVTVSKETPAVASAQVPRTRGMARRPDAEIVSVSGLGAVPVRNGAESAPEIIASVSAGMPLWPAALFAEQAPIHFVSYRKTVH